MQQFFEQFTSTARALLRRKWQAIGMAWGIALVGWAVVYIGVNPNYTAVAQVYIDTETVLRPLLKGLAVEVDPSGQLGLMTRLLMSKPNLERVVKQTGQDRQAGQPLPLGVALEGLRRNLSLQSLRTDPEAKFTNFYIITYSNRDPDLAKQVVRSLINTFAVNTLAESRKDSARAKSFLEKQIAEYREQSLISEKQLRDFKHDNVDVLPRGKQSYYDRLQSQQAQLEEVGLSIQQTESQRGALKSRLAVTPATTRALSANGQAIMGPLESRLAALETKLDELLLKYTEEHPDVIETKSSIRQLERQLKEGGDNPPSMPNPVYQQLELRLQDVDAQLAGLRAKQIAYRLRVKELQKQIQTLPPIEDELQRLTADYDQKVKNLKDLVARRQSMEMSESAGFSNEDLEFRVVEPPNVQVAAAMHAFRKKRLLLDSAVLVAGIVVGLGLTYAMEQVRPGIYTQGVLGRLTGLPVYGVISRVATAGSGGLRHRLEPVGFLAVCLLLLLAYAAVLLLELDGVYRVGGFAADSMHQWFGNLG